MLAVDNDKNGQVLQEGLARRLGKSRCQVLQYPTGKDLADVLLALGRDALRKTVALARYIPLPGLLRLSDFPERPPKRALDTMIPGLEPHLRIRRGDLIIVTGPPGHGQVDLRQQSRLQHDLALARQGGDGFDGAGCRKPDLRRVLRSYRAECLGEVHGRGRVPDR